MGLPTLLKPGHLVPAMGESQADLDKLKPISYILSWFRKRVGQSASSISDRIIVANSTTGSGKSTVMPAEIYMEFKQHLNNVIITQPRVVTAIDIPQTIVNVPVYAEKFKLTKNIGYQTGDYTLKPKEGLLFCTVGILLQMLSNSTPEEFCQKWKLIVLDEAHDRSIALDLVFFYMKQLIAKVPLSDYPFVILTSGTMDTSKYLRYFGTKTVFDIKGDSYPIETVYPSYTGKDYLSALVAKIIEIHETEDNDGMTCDIVAFLPTTGGIGKIKTLVTEYNKTRATGLLLPLSLDSATFKEVKQEYFRVFNKLEHLNMPTYSRKLILGTNAIETGITLESISFCVDSGLVNVMEYNPAMGCNLLTVRPVTQAMSLQRRGRVGRIRPGKFFPMYSDKSFSKMQVIQYPEILVSDVSQALLKIADSEGVGCSEIYDTVDTLDRLPRISVSNSLARLRAYGFVDGAGEIVNKPLIQVMNKMFTLPFSTACMLLACTLPDATADVLEVATIAALVAVGQQAVFTSDFKNFDLPLARRGDAQGDRLRHMPAVGKMKEMDEKGYDRLKSKAFIACEFTEWVIFFYRFKSMYRYHSLPITDPVTNQRYDNIEHFCDKNEVKLSGMLAICRARDEMIYILKTSGVKVAPTGTRQGRDLYSAYLRAVEFPEALPELVSRVIGLKQCISMGFKENESNYDVPSNSFICSYNGMTMDPKRAMRPYAVSLFDDAAANDPTLPQVKRSWHVANRITFDRLMIKRNAGTGKHDASPVGFISSLSGFV